MKGLVYIIDIRPHLLGILLALFGPLCIRIGCEILILSFRNNETLTEIKNNTKK